MYSPGRSRSRCEPVLKTYRKSLRFRLLFEQNWTVWVIRTVLQNGRSRVDDWFLTSVSRAIRRYVPHICPRRASRVDRLSWFTLHIGEPQSMGAFRFFSFFLPLLTLNMQSWITYRHDITTQGILLIVNVTYGKQILIKFNTGLGIYCFMPRLGNIDVDEKRLDLSIHISNRNVTNTTNWLNNYSLQSFIQI